MTTLKKKVAKATTTNYEATIAALSERPNSPRFFNYSYGLYDLNFYFANQIWVVEVRICGHFVHFLDVYKEFIFETKVITPKMEKLKNKLKL